MTSDNRNLTPQLFIARDIIDMAHKYRHDFGMLESLSNICFNLARIHENTGSPIDWDKVFSALDQASFNKDSSYLTELDATYSKITTLIEKLVASAGE